MQRDASDSRSSTTKQKYIAKNYIRSLSYNLQYEKAIRSSRPLLQSLRELIKERGIKEDKETSALLIGAGRTNFSVLFRRLPLLCNLEKQMVKCVFPSHCILIFNF